MVVRDVIYLMVLFVVFLLLIDVRSQRCIEINQSEKLRSEVFAKNCLLCLFLEDAFSFCRKFCKIRLMYSNFDIMHDWSLVMHFCGFVTDFKNALLQSQSRAEQTKEKSKMIIIFCFDHSC